MRANEDLRLFRIFTIADYEEEEVFLRQQNNAGYRLVRFALPGFYYFQKCQPEDVVYRLDFDNGNQDGRESYLQMFRDYGWEYMFRVSGWNYFRKAAAGEEDLEIFSDNASRLALVQRVFRTRMLPMLLIFLACVIPQLSQSVLGTFRYGFFVFWLVMFVLYVVLLVHSGLGLWKLKQKYGQEGGSL